MRTAVGCQAQQRPCIVVGKSLARIEVERLDYVVGKKVKHKVEEAHLAPALNDRQLPVALTQRPKHLGGGNVAMHTFAPMDKEHLREGGSLMVGGSGHRHLGIVLHKPPTLFLPNKCARDIGASMALVIGTAAHVVAGNVLMAEILTLIHRSGEGRLSSKDDLRVVFRRCCGTHQVDTREVGDVHHHLVERIDGEHTTLRCRRCRPGLLLPKCYAANFVIAIPRRHQVGHKLPTGQRRHCAEQQEKHQVAFSHNQPLPLPGTKRAPFCSAQWPMALLTPSTRIIA